MPKLRNRVTGVIIRVDDETADRLGAEWVPADAPAPESAPVKRKPGRPRKTED